jgi:probable HAF family extracellular repeat protein
MKKLCIYLLLNFIFCLCAFASPEYDIILLAPPGTERDSESVFETPILNNNGVVAGGIMINGRSLPYIYHKGECKILSSLDALGQLISVDKINGRDVIVGRYTPEGTWNEHVFAYDIQTDAIIDIMNHPDLAGKIILPYIIGITDENQIFVLNTFESVIFIYDMNKHEVSFDVKNTLRGVNASGQAIGGGQISWENGDSTPAWFFDSSIGYKEIGSLDKLKGWPVKPIMITKSGYVIGDGDEINNLGKCFIWNLEEGLTEITPLKRDNIVNVKSANDFGQIIGYSWYAGEMDRRPFIFNKDRGMIFLGTLGGSDGIAEAINNHNKVVGHSKTKFSSRAFIWDLSNKMRDLSTLIPQNTEWKYLYTATSINNNEWIVGHGYYSDRRHSFLLIPRKNNDKASNFIGSIKD